MGFCSYICVGLKYFEFCILFSILPSIETKCLELAIFHLFVCSFSPTILMIKVLSLRIASFLFHKGKSKLLTEISSVCHRSYFVLPGCSEPLGMKSGHIQDYQITASSVFRTLNMDMFAWEPRKARLDKQGKVNAWTSGHNDQSQWLQVNFHIKFHRHSSSLSFQHSLEETWHTEIIFV